MLLECYEWQLQRKRGSLDDGLVGLLNGKPHFSEMESNRTEHFGNTFGSYLVGLMEMESEQVLLYFPPNRFEDPAWLNINNLNARAENQDITNIANQTNRNIVIHEHLDKLKNWIFDLIFDELLNRKTISPILYTNNDEPEMLCDIVEAIKPNSMYQNILLILNEIFKEKFGNLHFKIGNRNERFISLFNDKKRICPNIFNLSTGETLLINLFFSILRDFDLMGKGYAKLEDITGIVVIDEIDLHLHSNLQKEVLPKLIKLFPKIQFIITTHSPLFVLGMEAEFQPDGVEIREMPTGEIISAERFKEFEQAFKYFTDTKTYEKSIEEKIKGSDKNCVLFVEGDSDKIILEIAWEKLYPDEPINFNIVNGFDRFFVGNTFLREDIFCGSNKTFVGLLDFDDAYENYEKVKSKQSDKTSVWDEIESSERLGLTLKHTKKNGYLMLLPVPEDREKFASKKQRSNSNLSIEFLFQDSLISKHVIEEEGAMGVLIPKFKDSKKISFAHETYRFQISDFENFKPLFEKIKDICIKSALPT